MLNGEKKKNKKDIDTFVTRIAMETLYHASGTGKFQAATTSCPRMRHIKENKNLMKTNINH